MFDLGSAECAGFPVISSIWEALGDAAARHFPMFAMDSRRAIGSAHLLELSASAN
jgi:hypothetical protein